MYIVNPEKIKGKYKCDDKVARYLVYECKIPILSIVGDDYYFSNTKALKRAIEKM